MIIHNQSFSLQPSYTKKTVLKPFYEVLEVPPWFLSFAFAFLFSHINQCCNSNRKDIQYCSIMEEAVVFYCFANEG